MEKKKSVFGLDENIAGLLCYLLGFISGIIILILERENKFVRFHALQSTIWFILLAIVNWVVGLILGWIPLIGGLITGAITLLIVASAIFLMYNAYMGNRFKIPVIGDVVEGQLGS